MPNQLKRLNQLFILGITDLMLVSIALIGSFLIRFEFHIPYPYINTLKNTIFIMIIIRLLCHYMLSLYQGVWRYASVKDSIRILQAVSLGTIIFSTIIFFIPRFYYPRSILIIDWLLNVFFIIAERFSIRILRGILPGKIAEGKRTLIIGAGDAGEKLLREIFENEVLEYNPVGFVDDNPAKFNKQIHNVKVLGTCKNLANIVSQQHIDQILIAIPSAGGNIMRRIIKQCEEVNVSFKTIPGIGDLIDGKVNVSQIRDINVEDLLRRPPVSINFDEISSYVTGKVILVTGAGGSIGSELARQIARFKPACLILLDHEETSMYHIEKEIKNTNPILSLIPLVASVRDKDKIKRIMQTNRPQVVFHAAAYKHVPLMEKNVDEAVKTNILGTKIVAEEAGAVKCEKFVLISSDKAVNPTNVMGATKRICELIIENIGKKSDTKFVSVRFGNVMGSRGSVIPHFKQQIAKGGPVEVTHPEMVRYFMTIPEAVQLVLQAGAIGRETEIFVLDMGEPVKIVELAYDLIKLSGLKPHEDIEIVYTGLRPGEKLFEEPLTQEEGIYASRCKHIFIARQDVIDNNKFINDLKDLDKMLENHNILGIIKKIQDIVPNYNPDIKNLKSYYEKTEAHLIRIK